MLKEYAQKLKTSLIPAAAVAIAQFIAATIYYWCKTVSHELMGQTRVSAVFPITLLCFGLGFIYIIRKVPPQNRFGADLLLYLTLIAFVLLEDSFIVPMMKLIDNSINLTVEIVVPARVLLAEKFVEFSLLWLCAGVILLIDKLTRGTEFLDAACFILIALIVAASSAAFKHTLFFNWLQKSYAASVSIALVAALSVWTPVAVIYFRRKNDGAKSYDTLFAPNKRLHKKLFNGISLGVITSVMCAAIVVPSVYFNLETDCLAPSETALSLKQTGRDFVYFLSDIDLASDYIDGKRDNMKVFASVPLNIPDNGKIKIDYSSNSESYVGINQLSVIVERGKNFGYTYVVKRLIQDDYEITDYLKNLECLTDVSGSLTELRFSAPDCKKIVDYDFSPIQRTLLDKKSPVKLKTAFEHLLVLTLPDEVAFEAAEGANVKIVSVG